MKKFFLLIFASLIITVGCSTDQETINKERKDKKVSEKSKENEPTQEELNKKLKEEAVKADFVELNTGDAEIGKRVFAEGVVNDIEGEGPLAGFTLTTKEGEGYGIYKIMNGALTEVSNKETVKVYGAYAGKDEETELPVIGVTIIESQ